MLKRSFDIVASLALIFLLSPVLLAIALVIKLHDHGPVFFLQDRVGRQRRLFRIYKFRTMRVDADAELERWRHAHPELWDEYQSASCKLKDDPRVTPLGAFLRKSSLDELPQLFNVLHGDMSLVGPRPLQAEESRAYGDAYLELYGKVRPGISGLWQVSGRSDTTVSERMDLDVEYVFRQSFWLDLKILFKTVPVVLKRTGAY